MNWTYNNQSITSIDDIPEDAIGFIYRIDNLTNGKFYLGKKDLYSVTNPQISKKKYDELKAAGEPVRMTKDRKKSKPGKPVWRYKRREVKKETNWLSYTGSNEQLNQDIKSGDTVIKTILRFCNSKRELTLREVEAQFKEEVLYRCDSYNSNILSKFFNQVQC